VSVNGSTVTDRAQSAGSQAGACVCRRLALVWRSVGVWNHGTSRSLVRSPAGVAALASLAARGVDRRALSPLVNAHAQASACERERSALALSSVAQGGMSVHLPGVTHLPGVSGLPGAHCSPSVPSRRDPAVDCLPWPWGAV
jgi:hypothetical protein